MTETDYAWLRARAERIRSRRAAQAPDEEPDYDAMSAGDYRALAANDRVRRRQAADDRDDRGLSATPQLSDQATT